MIGYNNVFISYGRKESRVFAAKLNDHLIKNDLEVWFDKDDIPSSSFYQNEIDKGIERADNFIFIIAPHSVASEYCLLELEHAIKLNKRIIPILHVESEERKINDTVRKIDWIMARELQDDTQPLEKWKPIDDFDSVIERLFKVLNSDDKDYFKKHKIILSKALNWEREGRPDSYLLRGFNLEQSQIWLEQGKKRETNQPLPIQEEFIKSSEDKKGSLNPEVFISYSTKDSKDIAHELNEHIQLHGITTWFDQESIATGEDFQKEIYKGIEQSSVFLFLISEKAVTSPYCESEVKHAVAFNKKIITVRIGETKKLSSELDKIQWIDFLKKPFYNAFGELMRELTVDREYLKELTRLLGKALEWERNSYADDFVLRGREYENAKEWLDKVIKLKKLPEPPEVVTKFLDKSQQLFEKLKKVEAYASLKNEALRNFVKPYLIEKGKQLRVEIEEIRKDLHDKYDPQKAFNLRLDYRYFDKTLELNTIENFIDDKGKWHPLPSEATGFTPLEAGDQVINTFPCCGKQVASDKTPSQFRDDGCEDAPS